MLLSLRCAADYLGRKLDSHPPRTSLMLRNLLVRSLLAALLLTEVLSLLATAAEPPVVRIDSPMSPPAWALLERELLRTNAAACEEFFKKYFDERGFLLCVERWGGDDGPDDAIENCNEWPLLYAMGASGGW